MQSTGTLGRVRYLPVSLYAAGLALLVISLFRPEAVITWLAPRATVILAMDISGSMLAEDVKPTRIDAAREAARGFIAEQPDDVMIGLVAFAESSLLVQPPTHDKEALSRAIGSLEAQPGTAVGSGILQALQALEPLAVPDDGEPTAPEQLQVPGSHQSSIIILMTDGQTTNGPDPIDSARLTSHYGIRVYTVGFGTTEGTLVPMGERFLHVDMDEATLRTVADITRAKYFHASDGEQLKHVYSTLTREFIEGRARTELTALFCLAAAILITLAVFISLGLTGRPL